MARGPADPVRVLVDSGAWIALVSADDTHHVRADAAFRAVLAGGIRLVTTNLIVAEVHRLLLHRAGIRPAAAFLERLDRGPRLTLAYPTAEHHAAARAWLARLADQRITYTDAVSFAVMASSRCDAALSFDHDFVLAGFALWPA